MTKPKNQFLRLIFLWIGFAPSPLLSQSTYEQRHDSYYDDISSRGINTGQHDGPHRAGRTGFWTTQGKLQRANESSGVWNNLVLTIADAFDANNDGETNLIEFATGQNPHASTRATPTLAEVGNSLKFTYTRSQAALADGILFNVEWSDTLANGSWSGNGVSEEVLADNGTLQTILASLPTTSGSRQFLHLKVIKP